MEEFRLCNALCDHMVLQRDEEGRIWGKGKKAGDFIKAQIGPYEGSTVVDINLTWQLFLPAMPVNCTPQTLTVTDGETTVTVNDVLIGDVWVVNGQSNAEITIAAANSNGKGIYDEEIKDIHASDNIRILEQYRDLACVKHPETMNEPQFDLIDPEISSWRKPDKQEDIMDVSAMGFFFAKYLSRALNASVPIGLVVIASAGSPMMELIMPELVAPMGYIKAEKENIPLAGMYNALAAPVQPMTIKGMLFYQGESEQWRCDKYPYHLKWYVDELRRRFEKNFPFYFVQISSHVGDGFEMWKRIEEVRYAQFDMLDLIDNSYLVVSMDVGGRKENADWAHPPYKKPVGERLAKYVLANEYGVGDVEFAASPVPFDWDFVDDTVYVYFENVGDGLKCAAGDKLVGFEAAGEDGEYKPVDGEIADDATVIFTGVKNPQKLRYAHMHDAYIENANLASSSDMPCAAFEIKKKTGLR